ncbi:MAG TPA: hypothetical protein VH988_29580 [Thermoanaerobaculia bacterium]|nr:hypothetical protein [Thermoanaerobaculia bacterium]
MGEILPQNAEPAPAAHVLLPLVTRRRQRGQWFQKLQHAIPAAALLMTGAQGILHGEHGFALGLAIGEVVMSALLLRTLVKDFAEVRQPHGAAHAGHHAGHGGHGGIDWFDVFVAGVLSVEALEHWHTHHRVPGPTVLLAAVTLTLGLLHGRIARRRMLRINDDGIRIGRRFFRQFDAPWKDIDRIDLDDKQACIVLHSGRNWRIKLTSLPNAADIRAALLAARSRLPQPVAPAPVISNTPSTSTATS